MDEETRLGRCPRCGRDLEPHTTGDLCTVCGRDDTETPTMRAAFSETTPDAPTVLGSSSAAEHATVLAANARPRARPAVRPVPGQIFGPYRIVRPLGHGGMGDVYEAEEIEHGRRVALKVLGQQLTGDADRERFLREGELAASITDAHTVYVYGSEEIDGAPVITMEFVPGGTLKDLVRAKGPLPTRDAVDRTLEIVAGLDAAHAAGILHRDVKPANCFVDRDGTVKVGDFGLSISTRGREGDASGVFQGTPQFAAPEQLRGEALDLRADIYAVGATLFYLLTGEPPFDDPDLTTLVTRVQGETPRSSRKLRAGVPPALARVVEECLAKRREDRPSTYAALVSLLEPFSSAAAPAAPLGRRIAAGVIDRALLPIVVTPLALSVIFTQDQHHLQLWVVVSQLVAGLVYFAGLEHVWGATIGKAILGLAVVDVHERRPGAGTALARAAIFLTPMLVASAPLVLIGESSTRLAFDHPAWFASTFAFGGALVLLLFSTARRANGFEAWHDRLTATRVVRRTTRLGRARVTPTEDVAPIESDGFRHRGPFHVTGSLGATDQGELVVGVDPRLHRRVWILERDAGSAPLPASRRDVSRPARPRWIAGRRADLEAWDAFEALDGEPLVRIAGARPWSVVKRWMVELATELDATLADGSAPPLGVDRVWITRSGSVRLLDFRPPEAGSGAPVEERPTAASTQAWLAAVAARGLAGERVVGDSDATGAALPVGLPLSARVAIDRLAARSFATLADAVEALSVAVGARDRVSAGRRAMSIAVGAVAPVFLTVLGFVAAVVMQRAPNGAEALAMCLHRLGELPETGGDAASERQAIEIVIAGRYRDVVASPLTWSMIVNREPLSRYQPLADDIVARHPDVNPNELQAAEHRLGPFYDQVAEAEGGAARRARIAFGVLPPFLAVVGVAVAVFCGVVSAFAFRGGLVLKLLGAAITAHDGKPASIVRAGFRGLVAWLPAAIFVTGTWAADISFNGAYSVGHPAALVLAACSLAVFMAGAVYAVVRPMRGVQDRLAGTWLVPI